MEESAEDVDIVLAVAKSARICFWLLPKSLMKLFGCLYSSNLFYLSDVGFGLTLTQQRGGSTVTDACRAHW